MDVAGQSAQTFTPDELNAAIQAIGVTQDPTRGLIGTAVFDCLANPAPDVQVTVDVGEDAGVITYYGPSDRATMPTGYVFFYNVPDGERTVTAKPAALEGGVSSVVNVNVAKFTTTAVGMFPTPAR
jgi:hypothetical protein